MRSLFVAMIILSASMAVVDTAQAQMQKPPGYGSTGSDQASAANPG
jgi:hypothetical protein